MLLARKNPPPHEPVQANERIDNEPVQANERVDFGTNPVTTEEEGGETESNPDNSDTMDVPNDSGNDDDSNGGDSNMPDRGEGAVVPNNRAAVPLNRTTTAQTDRPFVQRRGRTSLTVFGAQTQPRRSRGVPIITELQPNGTRNVAMGPYAAVQRGEAWNQPPPPRLEDVLRDNFDPGIPVALPKTVNELYRVWNLKNLGQYQGKTKHWKGPIKTRYKKWLTFIVAIQKKASHPRFRTEIDEGDVFAKQQHAVSDLEKERQQLKMTMTKFYDHLCNKEGRRGVRKRRREEQDDGEGI